MPEESLAGRRSTLARTIAVLVTIACPRDAHSWRTKFGERFKRGAPSRYEFAVAGCTLEVQLRCLFGFGIFHFGSSRQSRTAFCPHRIVVSRMARNGGAQRSPPLDRCFQGHIRLGSCERSYRRKRARRQGRRLMSCRIAADVWPAACPANRLFRGASAPVRLPLVVLVGPWRRHSSPRTRLGSVLDERQTNAARTKGFTTHNPLLICLDCENRDSLTRRNNRRLKRGELRARPRIIICT